MTHCHKHPSAIAVGYCMQCRRPFCGACLVETSSGRFCGILCAEDFSGIRTKVKSRAAASASAGVATKHWLKTSVLFVIVMAILYLALVRLGGSFSVGESLKGFLTQMETLIGLTFR